jgi:isopenicillin N synthase-like dioxygenase
LTEKPDFENRKEEITKQLVEAAELAGFFTLVDHGITKDEIESEFKVSREFFALPPEVKGKTPHSTSDNNGWEYKAQLRPSTGKYDEKESLWLSANSKWPSDEDVPAFRETTAAFINKCRAISDQVRKSRSLVQSRCCECPLTWQSRALPLLLASRKITSESPTIPHSPTA